VAGVEEVEVGAAAAAARSGDGLKPRRGAAGRVRPPAATLRGGSAVGLRPWSGARAAIFLSRRRGGVAGARAPCFSLFSHARNNVLPHFFIRLRRASARFFSFQKRAHVHTAHHHVGVL
jgi:hypothetical protein